MHLLGDEFNDICWFVGEERMHRSGMDATKLNNRLGLCNDLQ